jgi:hypothetical protein
MPATHVRPGTPVRPDFRVQEPELSRLLPGDPRLEV